MKTTRLSPDPAIVPGSDAFARFLATAHSSQNLNLSTTMHTQLPSSPSHSRRSRSALFGLALLAAAFVATAGLPPEESKNAKPAPPPAQKPPADPVPQTLVDFHAAHIHEFETAPGFGMRRMMVMPVATSVTLADVSYRAFKPDLIAVETKPVAYRSRGGELIGLRSLTNRTARASLPTRPITAEEDSAIAALREGAHLVQKETTIKTHTRAGAVEAPALLVVGALRAKATCARCHECPEGTLLGAFSYTLIPAAAINASSIPNFRGLLNP